MKTKLRSIVFLIRQFGLKWLLFRFSYAFRMLTGWFKLTMPAFSWEDHPLKFWLKPGIPNTDFEYGQWRKQNSPKYFFPTGTKLPESNSWKTHIAVQDAERLLSGELKYFEHDFYQVGFPPDWFLNPLTGKRLDSSIHWSKIDDFGDYDIKYVWEASRFSQVYTLVRAYAVRQDEKYAEAFWLMVEDWEKKNLPGRGLNWKCGQEASLRLMAWCFGYYGFLSASATTPERIALLTRVTAGLARRIHQNIQYAISTRSNHTISEGFGLYLSGLIFPEIKNADHYLALGRKLLEKEANSQILTDGTYTMYSLNYQRFILQIYIYALRLAEENLHSFPPATYGAIAKAIDFLYQLIDVSTGQMPEFGSNDGALVLPINNCLFMDYRPLLQSGYYLVNKKRLFKSGDWDEDLFWLFGRQSLESPMEDPIEQISRSFVQGGIYLLRNKNSKVVIRCSDYRERPSHADQLHLDLWWQGENIACDAGTYLYNGAGIWRNGLTHTQVHNTVTVDHLDQMEKFSRFTWSNWAKGEVLTEMNYSGIAIWEGKHDGYERLSDPVSHIRTVMMLPDDRWVVLDRLKATQNHQYYLQWLINDFPFEQFSGENKVILWPQTKGFQIKLGIVEGNSEFSIVRASENTTRGWRSHYYGVKEPAISLALESTSSAPTFWTYFGLKHDEITIDEKQLIIKYDERQIRLNLYSLNPEGTLTPGFVSISPEI